jgi:hypothetical protein
LFCVFKRCLSSFSPFLSREDRVNKLFFIIVFILALYTILLLEFYHCCVDVDFLFGTCIQQIWYYVNEQLRGPLRFKITLKSLWSLISVSLLPVLNTLNTVLMQICRTLYILMRGSWWSSFETNLK